MRFTKRSPRRSGNAMSPSRCDVFDGHCDLLDVTSLHRPDTAWVFVDAHGHEHRWHVDGKPAASYRPDAKHETPTLLWIKDGEEYWEDDDEPHDVGHLECTQCGEHVTPRYTADATTQHIAGLRNYRINGEPVTQEEFERRYKEACAAKGSPDA
jgi:hypothetical protein